MSRASSQTPSLPRRLWHGWKRIGKKVGDFQARLLLIVFYFTIVAPFALVVRVTADPLAVRRATTRGWRAHVVGAGEPLARALRQF